MIQLCPVCGRPRLLDVFSGEGGAGKGYMDAGFCVTPVDNDPVRLANYPDVCPGAQVIQGDAVAAILEHGPSHAVVHTSPTCTGYSQGTSAIPDRIARYDRLIPAVREALHMIDALYVIENVTSAATRAELRDPMMLCWTEFNTPGHVHDTDGTPLWMRRHRLFESNIPLLGAGGCNHPPRKRGTPGWVQCAGAYGGARRDAEEARTVRQGGYVPKSVDVMGQLLGIDWMSEKGCQLSIPPAYTRHIGEQALAFLEVAA